ISKNIMVIQAEHLFMPYESITRAEIAAALVKLARLYDKNAESYFDDVKSTHQLYSYIASSAEKGIVSGYGDDTFKPDNDIIYAEFTKMLGAILAYKKGYIYPDDWQTYVIFDNVEEINDWVIEYLSLCIREGFIEASDSITYEQDKPLTRLEAARLLYQLSLKL
nr:S-layer homology domain-containing protein [Vallitaleaceae bacterium]